MWYIKSSNARIVSSVLVLVVISLASGSESNHIVQKRQVGVLARSGALPQGKRSVEALARNGELPARNNNKRDDGEDYALEFLVRALGRSEDLSPMNVQSFSDGLHREQEAEYDEIGKRSVASLARNWELPQKRAYGYRSGYLIKPSHQTSNEEPDLLDPDDFLGKSGVDVLAVNGGFNVADGSLASFAKHGYEDNGEEVSYFDEDDFDEEKEPGEKRHVGAARNFFSDGKTTVGSPRGYYSYPGSGKRNLASFKNFLSSSSSGGKRSLGSALNFGKRNVGAAKNFFFSDKRNIAALKNMISSGKRNVGAARNFLLGESKRNLGAAKNFLTGNKRNLGAAKDFIYGKRNLASFARDGGFTSLKYPSMKEYDWDDFFDFDDFHEEEEKRNLGSFKNFGKRSAMDLEEERKDADEPKNVASKEKVGEKESNKTRTKREAYLEAPTDEYPMPVLQSFGEFDYGDAEPLTEGIDMQKRFLGSVASWPKNQQYPGVTKRHIGALARLGWLPSFRTTRYSRSGRAVSNRSMAPFRPNSSIGACPSEDANAYWSSPPSVETKVALGSRGIFRRVGRSVSKVNSILSGPQQRY